MRPHSTEVIGRRPLFLSLPVLDAICAQVEPRVGSSLHNAAIVAVQHLLETTGSLFEALIWLGAVPDRICVLGKGYSTNEGVAKRLSQMGVRVVESMVLGGTRGFKVDVDALWDVFCTEVYDHSPSVVIVLDDGGHCLAATPEGVASRFPVVGIEQTTSGLHYLPSPAGFPIIQVAASAAKKIVEPPMISRAVLSKVSALVPLHKRPARCGVIGMGNIGAAVAKDLLRQGHEVFFFDCREKPERRPPQAVPCNGINAVFDRSEYVFGCTGEDIIGEGDWLRSLTGTKTLVSCSSEDREFRGLFKFCDPTNSRTPTDTVLVRIGRCELKLLRGGFPVNFDGSPESVPASDIQMTRGLLLGALLQAALCRESKQTREYRALMLHPCIQRFVVAAWRDSTEDLQSSSHAEYWWRFDSHNWREWIEEHSGSGDRAECRLLDEVFQNGLRN